MIARFLAFGGVGGLLVACTAADLPLDRAGFRSSSTALLVGQASGPAVYTPPGGVQMPTAGISRSCVPQADGQGSTCRTF